MVSSGQFNSAFYPTTYPNNHAACLGRIVGPPGSRIRIRFHDMDIEYAENCIYDYILVSTTKLSHNEIKIALQLRYCYPIWRIVASVSSLGDSQKIFRNNIGIVGMKYHGRFRPENHWTSVQGGVPGACNSFSHFICICEIWRISWPLAKGSVWHPVQTDCTQKYWMITSKMCCEHGRSIDKVL